MADTLLNVINEDDEIIGQALRSEIHAKGLLHREVHVWFITPEKQVILQKRSLSKDTNPGLMTASVGGHVELGQTYAQAAFTEIKEETGLALKPEDIVFLGYYRFSIIDEKTGAHNNSIRALYGFVFKHPVEKLKVEEKDGEGFVLVPFDELVDPSKDMLEKTTPKLLNEEFALIQGKLLALVEYL